MSRSTTTQTDVKLPRSRNGKRIRHPFVELLDVATVEQVAKAIKVDRTSVYYHLKNAKANRDALTQAEMVPALVKLGGIEHYYWRPDLYPKGGIPAIENNSSQGVDTLNG